MATSGYKGSVLHRTLSEAFQRSGLKQQELADQLAVKQQTISGWMNGSARPATERFPEIENALGLDEGTLYATLTQTVGLPVVSASTSVPTPTVNIDDMDIPDGVAFASEISDWETWPVEEKQGVVDAVQLVLRGADDRHRRRSSN